LRDEPAERFEQDSRAVQERQERRDWAERRSDQLAEHGRFHGTTVMARCGRRRPNAHRRLFAMNAE